MNYLVYNILRSVHGVNDLVFQVCREEASTGLYRNPPVKHVYCVAFSKQYNEMAFSVQSLFREYRL